jgi:protein NrfD
MTEIISNKLNPNVLPHLDIWTWDVALYLFLGGLSGGLLILTSGKLLLQSGGLLHPKAPPRDPGLSLQVAALLAPVLLGLGMLFLFLDLELKLHVWRFYTNFNPTSPMSWGSWMLLGFFPLSGLQALIVCRSWFSSVPLLQRLADQAMPYRNALAVANVHLGAGIGVYTGILLSTFYARPLWSSSVLGFVFLFSGLSSAAAVLTLLSSEEERLGHAQLMAYAIAMEGFALTMYLVGGLTSTSSSRSAMWELVAGGHAPWFWLLDVVGGLLVPLLLITLIALRKVTYVPLVPILTLLGSLSLRFLIVGAGQAIPTIS